MTGSANLVKRLPNDIGGLAAGPISKVDHELLPWEKRCHALADVLKYTWLKADEVIAHIASLPKGLFDLPTGDALRG